MKSSVEKLSDTRVKVSVEIPIDELKPEIDQAYAALAQQVQIPGFRRGKAPRQLIEARFGRGAVMEQVVNDTLSNRYGQLLDEHELKVVSQPEIDLTKVDPNSGVDFNFEVDVRPEFEVPSFDDVAVEVPAIEVSDKDVEEALNSLRQRFGSLKEVERAAAKDDFVVMDLAATVDGEPLEEASAEGMSHQVGQDELIEGLDEAVVGLSAGESATFTTTVPGGEHEGKEAEVTVTVTTVKERELPEADDEFAQTASEFDTIEELRNDLRDNVAEQKKSEQLSPSVTLSSTKFSARPNSRCPRPWLTSRSRPRFSSCWPRLAATKSCSTPSSRPRGLPARSSRPMHANPLRRPSAPSSSSTPCPRSRSPRSASRISPIT